MAKKENETPAVLQPMDPETMAAAKSAADAELEMLAAREKEAEEAAIAAEFAKQKAEADAVAARSLEVRRAVAIGRKLVVVEPFTGTSKGVRTRFEEGPLSVPCDDLIEMIDRKLIEIR